MSQEAIEQIEGCVSSIEIELAFIKAALDKLRSSGSKGGPV